MPADTFEQLLDRAASQSGIEPGYWDIWGRYHDTTTAAKQAILEALGTAGRQLRSNWNIRLAALTRREWERLAPPAVVCAESAEQELPLNLRVESLGECARLVVRREDGQVSEFQLNLWELPQTAHIQMDGSTRVRKLASLPVRLPLGYHEISVQVGGCAASVRYIVTPDRAWVAPHLGRGGRTAGIAVSLYGVRSARNWGCGDFGDLLEIVDFAAEQLECRFRRAQSAARHPQSPAVQYQPLSPELHVLPEFPVSRRREHGGFRGLPARSPAAQFAGSDGRDRRLARVPIRGI